jgi:preprotein translocase subunit SecG
MLTILLVLLVLISIAIIGLVLIQHGKGADIGAAFGSGASSTVFGSQGSTSFLAKLTFGLVAVFFIICIVLTSMASRAANQSVVIVPPEAKTTTVPVTTVPVPEQNSKKQ